MWAILLWCFFSVQVSCIPTSLYTVTLHSQPKTWNEARWICEYNAGALLSIHNPSREEWLKRVLQAPPFHGAITGNVYVGLHHPSPDISDRAYVWSNCHAPSDTHWAGGHPHVLRSKFCISVDISTMEWSTEYCSDSKPFLCERIGGPCLYDAVPDKTAVDDNPHIKLSSTLAECQSLCNVGTRDGQECWALSFLSTSEACLLHFHSDVTYFRNSANLLKNVTSVLYVKTCLELLLDEATYGEVKHVSVQTYSPCRQPSPGLTATTYMLFQSPVTWYEANATCAEMGQSMYQPRTAEITFNAELGFNFSGDVWLGLEGSAAEGYRWGDGHPLGPYTLWGEGQGSSSTTPECAFRQLTSGQWASDLCTATKPFMCQRVMGECFFELVPDTRGIVSSFEGPDLLCYQRCPFHTDCVGVSLKLAILVECRVHNSSDKAFLYNPDNFETGVPPWQMFRPRCAYTVEFPGHPMTPADIPLMVGVDVAMLAQLESSQSPVLTGGATAASTDGTTLPTQTSLSSPAVSASSWHGASTAAASHILPSAVTATARVEPSPTSGSWPGLATSTHALEDHDVASMSSTPIDSSDATVLSASSASEFSLATAAHPTAMSTPYLQQTVVPETSRVRSSAARLCTCRCVRPSSTVENSVIRSLISELTVPKNSTALSRSRLESAEDHRPSARGMGVVAVLIIVLVPGVVVISDVITLALRYCT